MIKPAFGARAERRLKARSISLGARARRARMQLRRRAMAPAAWIAADLASRRMCRIAQAPPTRVTLGAISLSSSSHFALNAVFESMKAGDVAARPRQARDEASADRIGDHRRTRSEWLRSPACAAAHGRCRRRR